MTGLRVLCRTPGTQIRSRLALIRPQASFSRTACMTSTSRTLTAPARSFSQRKFCCLSSRTHTIICHRSGSVAMLLCHTTLTHSCCDAWECGIGSAYPCREELAGLYTKFAQKYPIVFFEDPFEEESFSEFTKFTASVDCQVRSTLAQATTSTTTAGRRSART